MNESTKQENARQSVTTNFSSESFRKKRQEDTLSIRKQRREEQHLARRQRTISLTPSPSSTPSPAPDQELQPLASQPVPGVETLTDENAVVAALASADVEKQLQATNKLRMVLSSCLCSVLCFHFCVFLGSHCLSLSFRCKSSNRPSCLSELHSVPRPFPFVPKHQASV